MRSEFMHDIFRQEFLHIYEEQKISRDNLTKRTELVLSGLSKEASRHYPSQLLNDVQLLSKRLDNTSGKRVYGYLKSDVKRLVDRIVDQIAELDDIKEAYEVWKEWQFAVDEMYGSQYQDIRVLSQEKKLKRIKNMVIQCALGMTVESEIKEEQKQDSANQQKTAQEVAITSVAKLIREISKLFEGELVKPYNQQRSIDRKSRKAMREKRAALGQKDTGMEL